ncbi:acetylserine transporter [Microvirga ossetica]|uniref:Acetylserine transporter n=1 Tax=Microvirga ossetica TaxID=1882682 RepID=A0A1B2EG16_9HYPH|nr:EamA family transporter [Microvirga ossetica]ANY78921.1 acetylserine transporter [Microvirga ossetica]
MPLSHSLAALLVTAIWGLSFVVIKLGVGTMPPLLLAALRFLFAALPAVIFIARPKTDWRHVVAYGFFLGVAQFGLLFAALGLGMPASLASVVMQAQVFFTILFAAVVMGERPGPHQVIGGLVASFGLVLIAWPRMTGGGAIPFLMTVVAAASWGVANIVSKKAGRVDMLGFIVWSSLVAPLPLLGLSLWLDGPTAVWTALTQIDGGTLLAVAYLAYPTTIFAFGIWAYLLSRHPAATVTPFALFVPVAGILGSALILGEAMHPIEAVGGAVIVLGLAFNIFGPRLMRRMV